MLGLGFKTLPRTCTRIFFFVNQQTTCLFGFVKIFHFFFLSQNRKTEFLKQKKSFFFFQKRILFFFFMFGQTRIGFPKRNKQRPNKFFPLTNKRKLKKKKNFSFANFFFSSPLPINFRRLALSDRLAVFFFSYS